MTAVPRCTWAAVSRAPYSKREQYVAAGDALAGKQNVAQEWNRKWNNTLVFPQFKESFHFLFHSWATFCFPASASPAATYCRELWSFNFFIFQFFQKILSRGPSLPCPLQTQCSSQVPGSAILESIRREAQELATPYKPSPGPAAQIRQNNEM